VPDGTAAAPAIAFESDDGNGIFLSTTDTVGIATNGSSRMTVSTTAVTTTLPVIVPDGTAAAPSVAFTGSGTDTGFYSDAANTLAASTGGTNALYIDSSQRVGIGTTSPTDHGSYGGTLEITGSPGGALYLTSSTDVGQLGMNSSGLQLRTRSEKDILFATNNTERARINSSGRLLVGTSSSIDSNSTIQVVGRDSIEAIRYSAPTGNAGAKIELSRSASNTVGTTAALSATDEMGEIRFKGASSASTFTTGATIIATVESGTISSSSFPTRLVFSTTADGASSPTERLRIDSSGDLIKVGGVIRGERGTAAAPAFSFSDDTDTGIFNISNADLGFSVGGTERARIDSSGRLLVGQSTSYSADAYIQSVRDSGQSKIYIESKSLADSQVTVFSAGGRRSGGSFRYSELGLYKHSGITETCSYLNLHSTDGSANYFWTDDSDVLRISTNAAAIGTTSGTVVGTQTSDERLKNVGENVSYGLNEVLQLQPKQYALKTEPDTNKLGFIAQEVESIIPEAVFDTGEELEGHQEGDRTKLGMEYVQLIPVLVNAIKEQQATITDLQTRLAALEAN